MSKPTLAGGMSPFAHLLAGTAAIAGRALGRRAADEQDEPDAEDEGNDPDAEDDGADNDDANPDAEDEGDEADAEDESGDPAAEDDGKEGKGKKADTPYRRGYAAANKRARAIFASPAAAGRPDLAAQLAFETRMSAAEAIGVLGTAGANAPKPRGRLDDRMGNRTEPRPGAGGGQGGKPSFADRAAAAAKKAGVKLG